MIREPLQGHSDTIFTEFTLVSPKSINAWFSWFLAKKKIQHINTWGFSPHDNNWQQFSSQRPRTEEKPLHSNQGWCFCHFSHVYVWTFTEAWVRYILYNFVYWTRLGFFCYCYFSEAENYPNWFLNLWATPRKNESQSRHVSTGIAGVSLCVYHWLHSCFWQKTHEHTSDVFILHPFTPWQAQHAPLCSELLLLTYIENCGDEQKGGFWPCRHMLITHSRACERLLKYFLCSDVDNICCEVQKCHIWADRITLN